MARPRAPSWGAPRLLLLSRRRRCGGLRGSLRDAPRAAALESAAAPRLDVASQRDRSDVRVIHCRAHDEILRRDHAAHKAAETAFELVDAIELFARLQHVGDGTPVVVIRAVG